MPSPKLRNGDKSMVNRIVDRFHVGTSDIEVIREMYRRLMKAGATGKKKRALRRAYYRAAVARHHKNQDLYKRVMTGRF